MVTVANKHTGVKSTFTNAEWDRISKAPQWSGVFVPVKEVRVPNEVRDYQTISSNGTASQKKPSEATAQADVTADKETNKNKPKTAEKPQTGDDKK